MFPTIFSIGFFTFYTSVPIILLGSFVGLFLLWKRARELRMDEETVFNSFFVLSIGTLLSARVGFALSQWSTWSSDLSLIWKFIQAPGLWVTAAVISLPLLVYRQAKQNKWDYYQALDLFVVSMCYFYAVSLLALSVHGYGWAKSTDLPFSWLYADGSRRFIIYPLESLVAFALCAYLWWLENTYRTYYWYRGKRSQANTGFISAIFFIGFGCIQFVFSWFQYSRIVLQGYPFDWFIHICLIAYGVYIILNRKGGKKRKKRNTASMFDTVLQKILAPFMVDEE